MSSKTLLVPGSATTATPPPQAATSIWTAPASAAVPAVKPVTVSVLAAPNTAPLRSSVGNAVETPAKPRPTSTSLSPTTAGTAGSPSSSRSPDKSPEAQLKSAAPSVNVLAAPLEASKKRLSVATPDSSFTQKLELQGKVAQLCETSPALDAPLQPDLAGISLLRAPSASVRELPRSEPGDLTAHWSPSAEADWGW
jgi:hypothetical protein